MVRTERKEHICVYCGRKFKARADAKYCSESCKVLAYRSRREKKSSLTGRNPFKGHSDTQNVERVTQRNYVAGTPVPDSLGGFIATGLISAAANAILNPRKGKKSSR